MPKYVVRHGVMRQLGVFGVRGSDSYSRGAQVIARTHRGLEVGEVLCEASDHVVSQMKEPKHGQILHLQSDEDLGEIRRLHEQEQSEHEVCRKHIEELGLEMQLIDVEHLYGGERVVVYYLSENRVDFRQLVKTLAKEFQTRIEMRQIGVRDEAKLLADYGDCGKPVCCNNHLSEMPPVSMRMAKLQKATLDPSKISGRCGRLKCCLRYEYDTYQELQKDLPPTGSEIITNNGKAKVLAQEILSGQILVQCEDMRRITIDASEVLTIVKRGTGSKKSKEKPVEKRTEARDSEIESKQTSDKEATDNETTGSKPDTDEKTESS
ncbi:MAG: regulatory iron-sulfur-containing complex subunit RicT [Lacipirellulaceae bacterium]